MNQYYQQVELGRDFPQEEWERQRSFHKPPKDWKKYYWETGSSHTPIPSNELHQPVFIELLQVNPYDPEEVINVIRVYGHIHKTTNKTYVLENVLNYLEKHEEPKLKKGASKVIKLPLILRINPFDFSTKLVIITIKGI